MIIKLQGDITGRQRVLILAKVRKLFPGRISHGKSFVSVDVFRNLYRHASRIESLPGVERIEPAIYETCARACRSHSRQNTSVRIGKLDIGEGNFTVIAGPCAVENEKGYLKIARAVKAAGAHMLRGQIFKPRTSPHAFQGVGLKGLKIISEAKRETHLPVATEVGDPRHLDAVCRVADVIQVGARNMRNYELLKELGRSRVPVMLKRSPGASLEEWLLSAEYILKGGNNRVFLCERGDIQTHRARPSLNLDMALAAMELTHLPVIVDPSHGTGLRSHVAPMAKAAAVIGVHGIMVEVHNSPETAFVDGKQSVSVPEFNKLMVEIQGIRF